MSLTSFGEIPYPARGLTSDVGFGFSTSGFKLRKYHFTSTFRTMGWSAWELSGLVLAEAFVITSSKVILKAKETIS